MRIGVSLKLFGLIAQEYGNRLLGMSIFDFTENIVKHVTARNGDSYVNYYIDQMQKNEKSEEEMAQYVGPANVYLSHTRSYLFLELVESLQSWIKTNGKGFTADKTFFWFDPLVSSQHGNLVKPLSWWRDEFPRVITDISFTLIALMPWDEPPIYLQRIRCLMEFYTTVQSGTAYDIVLPLNQKNEFVDHILLGDTHLNTGFKIFGNKARLDVESADSVWSQSVESCRKFIEAGNTIRPGFAAVNATLSVYIAKWAVQMATDVLSQLNSHQDDYNYDHHSTIMLEDSILQVMHNNLFFREGLEMSRACSSVREKTLGRLYPRTLSAEEYTGRFLIQAGRYAEAEAILRECYDRKRRVMGPKHIDTLTCLHHLATSLLRQQDGTLAQPQSPLSLLVSAESPSPMVAAVISASHSSTSSPLPPAAGSSTPSTLSAAPTPPTQLSKLKEAEVLFRECLDLCHEVLGDGHVHTIRSLEGLANAVEAQDRLAEAENLHRQCLAQRKKHRSLVQERSNTLRTLQQQQQQQDLRAWGNKADLNKKESPKLATKKSEEFCLDILTCMNLLAVNLLKQDRVDEAMTMFMQTMGCRKPIVGESEIDNLLSMRLLGAQLLAAGKTAEAQELLQEVHVNLDIHLGASHPLTSSTAALLLRPQAQQPDQKSTPPEHPQEHPQQQPSHQQEQEQSTTTVEQPQQSREPKEVIGFSPASPPLPPPRAAPSSSSFSSSSSSSSSSTTLAAAAVVVGIAAVAAYFFMPSKHKK